MDTNKITSRLKQLEEELLSESVRKNPQRLNKLLDVDFTEIGKSGKVWTKHTVIKALKNELFSEIQIDNFKLRFISETIALVTYTAHHKNKGDAPAVITMRSSIWKLYDDKWKIIFHQGTILK
jgi:glyoxylase I family protein